MARGLGAASGPGSELRRGPAAPPRRDGWRRLAERWRREVAARRRRSRARLLGAAALALGVALWLALSWLPGADPAPTDAPELPTELSAEPAEELAAGAAAVAEPAPTAATMSAGEPPPEPAGEGAPRAGLAEREAEPTFDQRAAAAAAWPIVALDPERQAELAPEPLAATDPRRFEVYVVAGGDTFLEVALGLGVDADDLAELNGLADRDRLAVGQKLLVPPPRGQQARAQLSSRGATLRPRFVWPARGPITTYFGERGWLWVGGRHTGLDIGGRTGDPVRAAEAGRVLEAGWSQGRGLGYYLLLDHGMGYHTLYGHLSVLRVRVGQQVTRGELIGDVGSTGVSTGPHLHFEVWTEGRSVDPLAHLP